MSDPFSSGPVNVNVGDESVKALIEFARVTGSSLANMCLGALDTVAPQLREWKFRNSLRLLMKIEEENASRKKAGKRSIPLRFAHPAFEVIGQEDNDDMLAMWARLFANLQDGDRSELAERFYIDIISSMEPVDAEILKWLADQERDDTRRPMIEISMNTLCDTLKLDRDRALVSLHNLTRLACVSTKTIDYHQKLVQSYIPMMRSRKNRDDDRTISRMFGVRAVGDYIIQDMEMDIQPGLAFVRSETMIFRLTILGVNLVDACRPAGEKTTASIYVANQQEDEEA